MAKASIVLLVGGKLMAEKENPVETVEVETVEDVAQIEDAAHFDESPEDEHEESGIAAKILMITGLLVAGGALALWIGPKIAPSLPSGMTPVSAWLSPGGEATQIEIAELRRSLEEIPQAVSAREIEAMIANQNQTLSTELEAQIAAVRDQVAASDSNEIESRLATVESRLEGLRAELSSLMAQLSDVLTTGGAVSAETNAQIATYAAAMEGLKAEIAALAAQNGALSQKIDNVSVVASRQVAEAESKVSAVEVNAEMERNTATIQSSLKAIDVALAAGLPFASALTALENAGVMDIPVALADASGGVATLPQLRADFPEAAHAAIRASILASAGDGLVAGISAFARAQVASRSLTPQEGLGPDAVLSRAEAALKQDDLATALAEIEALPVVSMPSEARGPMGDWVASATARLNAVEAYEALLDALTSE